jgi:hypothetical protein
MKIAGNITRFFLGICLCLSSITFAQTVTGSVTGNVSDNSGLMIAGATVTVMNVDTGITDTTITNGSGIYYIQYLRIGKYEISFTAPGFATSNFGPFSLEINQLAKINATLQIGAKTEEVTVRSEAAPIMNAESATVASTITSNTISNIPLNGQNFMGLAAFIPGAVNTEPASTGDVQASERYNSDDSIPSFNGNRQMSNNFILDGIEINETLNNTPAYSPNPDALDQITVVTTNASAEFGNANGGTVLAVTKGGTNNFHGSANAYVENNNLDANTWANKLSGAARSAYTRSIFNGTLGGPILRNKLFFFVDYEGMRYHTGGEGTASVAPDTWRTGNFSDLLSSKGVQLYDPSNNFSAYDGNQVPIVSSAATYLLKHEELYPRANQSPLTGNVALYNYKGHYKQYSTNDQGDMRIDWQISDRDKIYGRYSQGYGMDGEPTAVLPIDFPGYDYYPYKGGNISWAHTLSSNLVNEFRFGVSRSIYDEGNTTDPSGELGLNGNSLLGIPGTQTQPGFSYMAMNDGLVDSFGSLAWMVNMHETNYTYSDNVSWQYGHHMIKAGALLMRYQQNYMFPGNSGALGEFSYTGSFSGAAGSTGASFADFLLDRSSEATVGASYGYVGQRQWRDGIYVQDDWKVSPALTFNIGLRWEFFQPIYEVNNKEVNIDPSTLKFEYAGKNGNSRAHYNPTYINFEPRIGFAYQLSPRWVVRGGYGITNYLEGTGTSLRLTQNYPYNFSYDNVAIQPSSSTSGSSIKVEDGFGSATPTTASTTYYVWDKDLKPSLTEQYNLALEYQFSSDSSISASYVGEVGQHLIDAVYANQWKTIGDSSSAPYAALVGADGTQLGSTGTVKVTSSESKMNYNALQVVYRHRAAKGLEYTFNYTYGKALSNNPGFYGTLGVNGASAYWQNPYDPSADYGASYTDIRHMLTWTGVYELPFGPGKTYGANGNSLLNQVAGGWKVGMTGTFYTGLPVTIASAAEVNANTNLYSQRANHYRKLKIHHRSASNWFGTDDSASPCGRTDDTKCAYGNESNDAYGTAGVSTERAPGYRQVDASLFKAFHVINDQRVEFRTDFFNAMNMTSLGNPQNSTSYSNFGQITSSRSPQRQVQFSLKYIF